jgi:hypothetical protein
MNTRICRAVAVYILICALQGCVAEVADVSPVLTPSQVNVLTAQSDGKTIQVRGYFVLEPGGQNIYESKSKFKEFAREVKDGGPEFDAKAWSRYCLTIANPRILTNNLTVFANKTLVVKGTFVSNYFESHRFDLAACPLPGAIIINEDDLRARYPGLQP